jgi:hypothetical protein
MGHIFSAPTTESAFSLTQCRIQRLIEPDSQLRSLSSSTLIARRLIRALGGFARFAMKINIRYQCRDRALRVITLTPEEYFDPIESGESYEHDGVPKFNHAKDYLGLSSEELDWTELQLTETDNDQIIRTDFYAHGKSAMSQRKDSDGYEEIILETQIAESISHIIRVYKDKSSKWKVIYNGLIENLADGSQRETKIVP